MWTVILSALFYFVLRLSVKRFSLISKSVPPWKYAVWYNTLVSYINSILMSASCLYCFYIDPKRAFDLAAAETNDFVLSVPLVCIGYFIYDTIDCAINMTFKEAWKIQSHHVLVIFCYAVGIYVGYYNYIIVSLLYEINTIFLHQRKLSHLARVSPKNLLYNCNRLLNVVSFVLFRIVNFSWIIYFTAFYVEVQVSPWAYWLGMLAMVLLLVTNTMLLGELIQKDYRRQKKDFTQHMSNGIAKRKAN